MTGWHDVASPRSHMHEPGWLARHRPRPELPPHPLESLRLQAMRSAARTAGLRIALVAAAVFGVWGGLHLGKRLPVFLVERVEVEGNGYLTQDEVRAVAGLAGAVSVWESTSDIEVRLARHPLVESAKVERALPSTFVIRVEEAAPVGLVASPVAVAVDRNGDVLPLDPTEPILDLPVLRVLTSLASASWGLRILARDVEHVAEVAPEVFAVLSEARLDDREATLLLGDSGLRVRYHPPISQRRLREAVIAINDAYERVADGGLEEIDLRFADQVVVRTAASPAVEDGAGG
ncbi:MAG: FtsQ-type POTRA domain-containing protein [Gemmatimonadetes bacterium]|nr:FtsQ-type POTRA domain-containing protein [Gemmatimonadota bacterium]MYA64628.1 FtsQ-type POTRA domain-containing protein [Gemmatimonadota bacterium]MYB97046.1 FtsQ-type POTRA domain-containing protein [Gemmatimonadota bacterium]MYH52531.1 FtsQ-type POTRA domain-containing protein [Gemmatimonadota bacterium]MYI46317.1 FtsQ-type POTRA domain-containing protein [Gemmatimonadota bacterium]